MTKSKNFSEFELYTAHPNLIPRKHIPFERSKSPLQSIFPGALASRPPLFIYQLLSPRKESASARFHSEIVFLIVYLEAGWKPAPRKKCPPTKSFFRGQTFQLPTAISATSHSRENLPGTEAGSKNNKSAHRAGLNVRTCL